MFTSKILFKCDWIKLYVASLILTAKCGGISKTLESFEHIVFKLKKFFFEARLAFLTDKLEIEAI